jgi:hypothetical protein
MSDQEEDCTFDDRPVSLLSNRARSRRTGSEGGGAPPRSSTLPASVRTGLKRSRTQEGEGSVVPRRRRMDQDEDRYRGETKAQPKESVLLSSHTTHWFQSEDGALRFAV